MAKKRTRKRRKPAAKPAQRETETARVERELATAAFGKRLVGEKPKRDETAALKRVENSQEEADRQRHYRSVPAQHYRQLTGGRNWKTVRQQADRWGLPIAGKTVDLFVAIKAFHDLLAKYGKVMAANDPDAEAEPTALEEIRRERARIEKIKRKLLERRLVDREEVTAGLSIFADLLRQMGEQLQRDYGADAGTLLNDTLDDAINSVRNLFPLKATDDETI